SPEVRAAQFDAIARILDGFVGDLEPVPELTRLRTILIRGIDVTFRDDVLNQTWRTEDSDLRIERTNAGATARLSSVLGEEAGSRIPIGLTMTRLRGTGETQANFSFTNLTPQIISEQVPQMEWRSLVDGALTGAVALSIARDGELGPITGTLAAVNGAVTLMGEPPQRFDRLGMEFAYHPAHERLDIASLSVEAPSAKADVTGSVDLIRAPEGDIVGLATRMEIQRLSIALPEVFAEDLSFDGGQIAARAKLDKGGHLEAKGFLRNGDLSLAVDGRMLNGPSGWVTDIRASGQNVGVGALMAHWPKAAAVNARSWIAENVVAGQVDQVLTHLRFSEGEPQLNLEFTFSDLQAQYLPGMSLVREAKGRGHLTLHDLYLFMDRGHVTPVASEEITLDGSSLVFRDLSGIVTPAEVTLTGAGDLGAVLTLIDEEPLSLVSKLDLDPTTIEGRAEVEALITFPLLQDLLLEEIFVDLAAELADVRMPFQLSGQRVDVAGDAVAIKGSITEMTVKGDVTVDGTPLNLAWTESYGKGANHRQIAAKGRVTPQLIARAGIALPGFGGGSALVDVTLAQTGTLAFEVDLIADLAAAELSAPQLDWDKPRGALGSLELAGRLGDTTVIERLAFKSSGLEVRGRAELGGRSGVVLADLDRIRLRDRLDLAVQVRETAEGFEAVLQGQYLNLERFLELAETRVDPGGDGGPPLIAQFDIEEVRLSDSERLLSAKGDLRRSGTSIEAEATGRLGPALLAIQFDDAGASPASLSIQSQQAGELVDYFGIYEGAQGGSLNLIAELEPEPGIDISGLLKIRGLELERGEGLKTVLTAGRFADEQVAEVSSGLTFGSIRVPFNYAEGELRLGESFAKSPSLAITAEGAVNPGADRIELVGVISPAYGLTSALDDVPVLGSILTGGEGKGLFGMTFSMSGSLDDPEISVNPLSLLTPGFLRGVFSGGSRGPDAAFIDRLETQQR
ncbi:MAG: AsmA-like C-terminal domain-containing protein, partial [Pseudomonadota bacterium]